MANKLEKSQVDTVQEKPLLFIDVDGVLFAIYDGALQLRPGVISFLAWCLERFECHWLTCWGDGAQKIGRYIYGERVFNKITGIPWHDDEHKHNKAIGAVSFANGRPFYWIEDDLPVDELKVLEKYGLMDSYIHVCEIGRDELVRVKDKLEAKLAHLPRQKGIRSREDPQ